jgi:hypothetical protein
MQDLIIKVENEEVGKAVGLFFDNYKEPFAQFLNNVLKTETGSADAFVSIKKAESGLIEAIDVYQTAPDKGFVLAQVPSLKVATTDAELATPQYEVQVSEYLSLPVEAKYVVFDGAKLALFIKREEGVPDYKIGNFANLNDVVTQIDSESVKNAIDTIKAAERNAEVDKEKFAKQARKALKAAERRND